MQKLIIIIAGLFLINAQAFSQNITISGQVLDKTTNETIPGVTIIVKDTNNGTISDFDGNYKLSIEPGENQILIFSFIGYVNQELVIGSQSVINVSLATDYLQLDEVIVTAMNISQNKRALNYAAQDIKGAEIAESQQQNIVNSLQGKIAGVQVTSSSGSPGSSTSIIIRGGTSIGEERDNQPIFVVDGIIMDNSTFEGSGNRAMDINPDDVASMTVLKGPSAAALYGIGAGNGAIIITTKSGQQGKMRVNFSSTVAFDRKFKTHEVQTTYGRGFNGVYDDETYSMWGAAYTNADKIYDNIDEFFQTSVQQKYSLSMSGGNEKSTFFLSTSNNNQTGIVPGEDYNRFNLLLKASSKLRENLTVTASVNSILSTNVKGGSGSMRNVFTYPTDDQMTNYINPDGTVNYLIDNEDDEQYKYNRDNAYWTINNNLPEYEINRTISQVFFDWDVSESIKLTQRVGMDRSNQFYQKVTMNGSTGSLTNFEGVITQSEKSSSRITSTFIANYNKEIGADWNFNVLLGVNNEMFSSRSMKIVGENFNTPGKIGINFVETITNPDNTGTFQNTAKKRTFGVFGEAKLDYKGIASIGFTGRNDFSSTLPSTNNSFFYPSITLGFVFTEILENDFGGILSYGKIRANWANSGQDANVESLNPQLIPYPGLGKGYNNLHTAGNPYLLPEFLESLELGANLALFEGRFNLDFTYYKTKAIDMIIRNRISSASGFIIQTFNSGDVVNKGIEIVLDSKIINRENLKWSATFNYARNRSVLSNLPGYISRLPITSGQIINEAIPYAILDRPVYAIDGSTYLRNENGNMVLDEDGYPRIGNYEKDANGEYILNSDGTRTVSLDNVYLGNREPDFLIGITNSFRYKKIDLSFLFDIRKGGDVINATASQMMSSGTHKLLDDVRNTTYTFSGVVETPEGFVTNTQQVVLDESYFRFGSYRQVGENFVEDGSWVKLRYVAISYDMTSLVKKMNIQALKFTVTGRNLFMLSNYSGGDPEKDFSGSVIGGAGTVGLDYFNVPTTQGITFSLNATF